jgi:ubiquinone biosynthesis protein COQ9
MIRDHSAGYTETYAFLDRRMKDLDFGHSVKAEIRSVAGFLAEAAKGFLPR